MNAYMAKNRDNGAACWSERPCAVKRSLVTPELRAALSLLLETDPERFIAACKEAQVTSLRQIPAWMDLHMSAVKADRFRAREIAVLAEDAGIEHRV